jgi:hypothetical protein
MNEQILINSTTEIGLLSVMIDGKPCVLADEQKLAVLHKLEEIKQIVEG